MKTKVLQQQSSSNFAISYDYRTCSPLGIDEQDAGTGGNPRPRCLSTLPNNIEELVNEFKMQESLLS